MTKYPVLVYSVGGPDLKVSDLSILPGLPRGIMAVVPSDLYPYIYGFLVNNSLPKTAKAFLKEATSVRRSKFFEQAFLFNFRSQPHAHLRVMDYWKSTHSIGREL